jgi:hypothetical protein
MQTQKDAEIVGWLGRIGAASAEHVMDRVGMGRSGVVLTMRNARGESGDADD